MNILIAGGTGFVGKHLTESLILQGHHVYILTRSQNSSETPAITYLTYDDKMDQLPTINAVINLAGESLFGYWTKNKKSEILSSRIETTRKLIKFMKQMQVKPAVFINGSAIGFYGVSDTAIFTEKTILVGEGFLADVVKQWEETAKVTEHLGIRTIYARFGLILGHDGALPLMSLPVKFFAGGKIGHGEQWISWIHIDDVINLIHFCLDNDQIKGPLNVVAPNPKRNKDFIKTLAHTLKRPYWLPTPARLIRLATGEMSELITNGQYVLPKRAIDHHFTFTFNHLEEALRDIQS